MVLIKNGIDKNVAFIGTLIGLSLVNYFVLKWVIARATASAEAKQKNMSKAKKVRGGALYKTTSFVPSSSSMNVIHSLWKQWDHDGMNSSYSLLMRMDIANRRTKNENGAWPSLEWTAEQNLKETNVFAKHIISECHGLLLFSTV